MTDGGTLYSNAAGADAGFLERGVNIVCARKILTTPQNRLTTVLIIAIEWPLAAVWQQNAPYRQFLTSEVSLLSFMQH